MQRMRLLTLSELAVHPRYQRQIMLATGVFSGVFEALLQNLVKQYGHI